MRRGQAINTTRRHARRQATPKARFIRARTKGRRVDFYLENLPTVGSLVSNYRNAVALGHSCLTPLSSIFPSQRSLNLYDNARVRFHLLNKHATDTCMCMQERESVSPRVHSTASLNCN